MVQHGRGIHGGMLNPTSNEHIPIKCGKVPHPRFFKVKEDRIHCLSMQVHLAKFECVCVVVCWGMWGGTVKLIVAGQEAGRQACGGAQGAEQC